MSTPLESLAVIVLDCQASGATPAHGDLLELGWALTNGVTAAVAPAAAWVTPATDRPISRVVRKLTGWDEPALGSSIAPADAWSRIAALASAPPAPTVIHFARFELTFLRQLHATHAAATAFPLDVVCLHAVGCRLFPDLPRRSLRALAGHLGASPQMIRRAQGHVDVTAHVWRALVPLLAARGVTTWEALQTWLTAPAPASKRRAFPISDEKRKALPNEPGVYRFVRPNGDVLYVGKAANIRKRIQSHYTSAAGSRTTERALEMLSQAHDVAFTVTPTALEAALLEADEIKRLDPPYNIHLRKGDRFAWFASADWQITSPAVTDLHRLGPLPSRTAISGVAAIRALLEGALPSDARRADAVGVPHAFTPPADLFEEAWAPFVARELAGPGRVETRILTAAKRIVVKERPEDEEAPAGWDVATVTRYLERVVVTEGTLVLRARMLTLLTDARVTFREAKSRSTRHLHVRGGAIVAGDASPPQRPPPRRVRQGDFDAGRYDRLRVLATELRRVALEGGEIEVRVGHHVHRHPA